MGCGFKEWFDPPMCSRAKKIIPGLLRSMNRKDEEIERLNAIVVSSIGGVLPRTCNCGKGGGGFGFRIFCLMIIVIASGLVYLYFNSSGMDSLSCRLPLP